MKNYVYISDIIETTNIDETYNYKLLDNLETKLRNEYTFGIHSISKRECAIFDTYVKASYFRRNLTDRQN